MLWHEQAWQYNANGDESRQRHPEEQSVHDTRQSLPLLQFEVNDDGVRLDDVAVTAVLQVVSWCVDGGRRHCRAPGRQLVRRRWSPARSSPAVRWWAWARLPVGGLRGWRWLPWSRCMWPPTARCSLSTCPLAEQTTSWVEMLVWACCRFRSFRPMSSDRLTAAGDLMSTSVPLVANTR